MHPDVPYFSILITLSNARRLCVILLLTCTTHTIAITIVAMSQKILTSNKSNYFQMNYINYQLKVITKNFQLPKSSKNDEKLPKII